MNKFQDDIANLLESKPLYSSLRINDEGRYDLYEYRDISFSYQCPIDKGIKTFLLQVDEHRMGTLENFKRITKDDIKGLNKTLRFKGTCMHCKRYQVDFTLNIYEKNDEVLIRKVGQYPPFSIIPDKEVSDFLTEEDNYFYRKALMNLSASYGIGAFAYFRRIVENEIKRIVEYLSELNIENSPLILEAYDKFKNDHQMSSLIESVYPHLPSSLKELGENPLKLLYGQLSIGIHTLSEEECMKRAIGIDEIFKFVIKQLNLEKYEKKSVIEAIKKLK